MPADRADPDPGPARRRGRRLRCSSPVRRVRRGHRRRRRRDHAARRRPAAGVGLHVRRHQHPDRGAPVHARRGAVHRRPSPAHPSRRTGPRRPDDAAVDGVQPRRPRRRGTGRVRVPAVGRPHPRRCHEPVPQPARGAVRGSARRRPRDGGRRGAGHHHDAVGGRAGDDRSRARGERQLPLRRAPGIGDGRRPAGCPRRRGALRPPRPRLRRRPQRDGRGP